MPHSVILVIDQGVKQQKKIKKNIKPLLKYIYLVHFGRHVTSISGILKQTQFFAAAGNIMLKCVSYLKRLQIFAFFQIRLDIIFDSSIDSFL